MLGPMSEMMGALGKSTAHPLTGAINSWQSGGTPVYRSGVPETQFAAGLYIPSPQAECTYINVGQSIRQAGKITGCLIWVNSCKAGDVWAFRIYRYNSGTSQYECIASRDITPVNSNGNQTFTFSTPIDVIEGDVPGIYLPNGNYNRVTVGAPISQNPYPRYVNANIALGQSDAFASTYANPYHLQIQALGPRPYAAFLGDSIIQGGNGTVANDRWKSDQENVYTLHSPGGSPGDINHSVAYRFSRSMPPMQYQSFAKSGNKFSDCVTTTGTLSRLVRCDPKLVIIHCGVNDVAASRTWTQISADLDTIRTTLTAGTKVLLDEVLPWQCSDALAAATRALNANFATYCSTYDWRLVVCHDAMGQTRGSTGQLDDLIPAYSNGDSVHLSLAGVDKLATLQYQTLQSNIAWALA